MFGFNNSLLGRAIDVLLSATITLRERGFARSSSAAFVLALGCAAVADVRDALAYWGRS